jgi:dTMP kinase
VSAARDEKPAARRGSFVVLDGVDGCGKSTQARLLVEALSAAGSVPPLHVREPGSTRVGEALRAILLGRDHAPAPRVEALLFAAARAQMLEELVEPALAAGRDVVCERFHPSTFAYQAVAGGLDETAVIELLERWAGKPRPDVVIVLDVSPEIALARRGRSNDRIEDKGVEFQRAVARGYARYAELVRSTVVIDGAREERCVARDVLAAVRRAQNTPEGQRAPGDRKGRGSGDALR